LGIEHWSDPDRAFRQVTLELHPMSTLIQVAAMGLWTGSHFPIEALAVLMALGIACGVPAATLFWIVGVKRRR